MKTKKEIAQTNIAIANTTKKICIHCDKGFTLGNIKKHEKACKLNLANFKECPVCGTMHSKGGVTCSYGCSNTYFRTSVNHPNWSGNNYAKICFEHHGKKCIICGETTIVAVHHLDEDHSNNDPENLIPLCPTHHQYWHSRHKHLIEQKVLDYVQNRTIRE